MKQKSKILFFHREEKTIKILLGKRIVGTMEEFWWLPGGSVEIGEETFEAAVREIHEELFPDDILSKILNNYLQLGSKIPSVSYRTDNSSNTVFFLKLPYLPIPEIKDEFTALQWFSIVSLPENMSREFQHIKAYVVPDYFHGLEYQIEYSKLLD